MVFSCSPRLADLEESAVDVARKIMVYEDACEAGDGSGRRSRAALRQTAPASGPQARNTPGAWGGAEPNWVEQRGLPGLLRFSTASAEENERPGEGRPADGRTAEATTADGTTADATTVDGPGDGMGEGRDVTPAGAPGESPGARGPLGEGAAR